jgi:hypothetical protein
MRMQAERRCRRTRHGQLVEWGFVLPVVSHGTTPMAYTQLEHGIFQPFGAAREQQDISDVFGTLVKFGIAVSLQSFTQHVAELRVPTDNKHVMHGWCFDCLKAG